MLKAGLMRSGERVIAMEIQDMGGCGALSIIVA
jgi:hypothetical protein